MPIAFNTDATSSSSSITNLSSVNLLMLIEITGGLLLICLILLTIVMIRSKVRRRKAQLITQPIVAKEIIEAPADKKEEKAVTPFVQEEIFEKKIEPKKEIVEAVIKKEPVIEKKENVKPMLEAKNEEIKTVIEIKVPEVKKEVVEVVINNEPLTPIDIGTQDDKKPDEGIIKIEEKKPEITPVSTTIEQKKEHFRKALEETQSKDDNLKILQERLAELSKEKKATITFTETEKIETEQKDEPVKDPTIPIAIGTQDDKKKKDPVEHVKLVDLTALINEKLQGTTEKKEDPSVILRQAQDDKKQEEVLKQETGGLLKINNKPPTVFQHDEEETRLHVVEKTEDTDLSLGTGKQEVKVPSIIEKKEEDVLELGNLSNKMPEKNEEPIVNSKENAEALEDSHKILTPFFDNIKLNNEQLVDEEEKLKQETKVSQHDNQEGVIIEIEEALSIESIDEKNEKITVDEKEVEKPKEISYQTKDNVPKTFTEWLNTLKK